MIKEIEKAIMTCQISASTLPTMVQVVRLVFPELTEERRKELVKDVKKKGEAGKSCCQQYPHAMVMMYSRSWQGQRRIRG